MQKANFIKHLFIYLLSGTHLPYTRIIFSRDKQAIVLHSEDKVVNSMRYMGKARKDANRIHTLSFFLLFGFFYFLAFFENGLSPAMFLVWWHAKDKGVNVN